MLIIGHRGSAGTNPENTIQGVRAAIKAGADMVHIDVRLTRDNVPVLLHDARLIRTHTQKAGIANLTYAELLARTKQHPVPTLTDILDRFFGKILIVVELKSRGSADEVYAVIEKHYIKKQHDWENILIASTHSSELLRLRKLEPAANLCLMQTNNPFSFVAYQRFVQFTAIGFHRLHLNPLALQIAKRAGLFTFAYTVNRPSAIPLLAEDGIDGVMTNYPAKCIAYLEK